MDIYKICIPYILIIRISHYVARQISPSGTFHYSVVNHTRGFYNLFINIIDCYCYIEYTLYSVESDENNMTLYMVYMSFFMHL